MPNPAVDPVPFGHWTPRDKAAQRRSLLRWALPMIRILVMLSVAVLGCLQPLHAAEPSRLHVAEAMFGERCKTAGEKIHRTAENVEGVFLMKIRPHDINYRDQFKLDDPYGRDLGGDGYILSFLSGFFEANVKRPDVPAKVVYPHIAYRYVEALDPKDGKRYRYTGSTKEVTHTTSVLMGGDGKTTFKTKDFVLDKVMSPGPTPRYGVTYDDISTREERDYWIAGSSLKVIDLQTNEVMAERIGYMVDRGQGDKGGGRSPWLFAADTACPEFSPRHGSTAQLLQTENFVEKVLKPKLEK